MTMIVNKGNIKRKKNISKGSHQKFYQDFESQNNIPIIITHK